MHGFVSLRVDQRVALALAGQEARLVQGLGKRGSGCPLNSESDRITASPRNVAMCHKSEVPERINDVRSWGVIRTEYARCEPFRFWTPLRTKAGCKFRSAAIATLIQSSSASRTQRYTSGCRSWRRGRNPQHRERAGPERAPSGARHVCGSVARGSGDPLLTHRLFYRSETAG